jgi:hypothetical protein
MNNQTPHGIVRSLIAEIFEMNERVMCGDICSSKTAIPKATKLCALHARLLLKQGMTNVRMEPYEAAGGWVGLTYSYDQPGCDPVCASVVPRRIGA